MFEAVVNLTQSSVERKEALGARMHGSVDFEEAEEVEKIVLNDPSVHREITRRKVDPSLVVVEPWIFGKPTDLSY